MSKFAATCLVLLAHASPFNISILNAATETAQPKSSVEPKIHSKFYTAEAIYILPHLKYLDNSDPGFNKIVFTFEGFPTNKEIIFEIKRLASKTPDQFTQLITFSIQNDGTYIVNTQPQKHLDTIIASSRGFLPGERITYRFRTADGTVDKEASGIPAPMTFKNDDGKVVMRAELLSISPTVYAIDFPTMSEGEEFEIKSTSIGDTVTATPKFSKDKPFHYSPAASNGKTGGGEGYLEVKRKSGETYYMKLPWGSFLDIYLKGKKAHLYH